MGYISNHLRSQAELKLYNNVEAIKGFVSHIKTKLDEIVEIKINDPEAEIEIDGLINLLKTKLTTDIIDQY